MVTIKMTYHSNVGKDAQEFKLSCNSRKNVCENNKTTLGNN